jgi:low temperature requirement protein LtrA
MQEANVVAQNVVAQLAQMAKNIWEPPRLRVGEQEDGERRATWLELFFDLVFVVAIAELGHNLSADVSVTGFLSFTALFAPVWWCWVGQTFYATRFDTDDLGHRLLTLLQIAIVAALAVNIHHAFTTSSVGFALSYAAFRAVLVFQYLSAGYFVPTARPLIKYYFAGFGLGATLWGLSVFVPTPWRFAVWILGLVVDLMTPILASQEVSKIPPSFSHIPERLGLFVIIVLGESILAVVKGISGLTWTTAAIATAFLGLSIAFSMWWIYFDTVDGSPLMSMKAGRIYIGLLWLYMHLPFAIGLGATGIGVEHFIKNSGKLIPDYDRWLLCVGVSFCLISLAVIHYITCTFGARNKHWSAYRLGSAAFVLMIATLGTSLSPVLLITLIVIACLIQVILGLWENRRVQPS